jgi:hypothetical protein
MRSAPREVTTDQCKDAGLALVLICLFCRLAWEQPIFTHASILFLLVAMTYPRAFTYFAIGWLTFSTTLGAVVSRVVLAVLFFAVVLPVGRVRRWLGKDAMQLKRWKKGDGSAFHVRNQRITARDLEHPY